MATDVLYHFSEDPTIEVFRPHVAATAREPEPLVWAINEDKAPLYWFPRRCPRVTYWAVSSTTAEDGDRFLGHTEAQRVHAIESRWIERMRACRLFVYRLPVEPFELLDEAGGFWVARQDVTLLSVEPVGDLLDRHAGAGIELRITPSLRPLAEAVAASSLGFSMVRMANTAEAAGFPPTGHSQ